MQPTPQNHYPKFFLMLAASFVVMYGVMYLNTYQWSDVYPSLMRFYMTLLMVLPMGLIMLGFMRKMYPNRSANLFISGSFSTLFVVVWFMMRQQAFIGDVRWLEGMIPHHSIAVLTSKRASLHDPQVRVLADSIIAAQQREIKMMEGYLQRLKQQ